MSNVFANQEHIINIIRSMSILITQKNSPIFREIYMRIVAEKNSYRHLTVDNLYTLNTGRVVS